MNNFLFSRSFKPRFSARIYLGVGLLLLLLLQSAVSFAQKITLNYQKVPLEQVLREIRKQSGYDIFFDQNLVVQQPRVAIKITNANVEEAMDMVLKGLPLTYVINGRAISIKKSDKVIASARQQKITVTGMVIDENGSIMSGVSVSVANVKPVYTDGLGKFTLKDIEPLSIVRISYTGYTTVERTALAISLMGEIHLQTEFVNLNTTIIQGQRSSGTSMSNKIDLDKRRHQTLGFVLESTIPGLVLRKQRNVNKTELYRADGSSAFYPAGEYTFEEYYELTVKMFATLGIFDAAGIRAAVQDRFEEGRKTGVVVSRNAVDDGGVIPELRGAGGFGNGNNAMLVVIDGFVQNSFPADYSLNNVLSVEVIRDPAETIKWGPRAANGVIIVTTNGGKPGTLQIDYTSTFNFSEPTDNSAAALQRANTSQILDYYLDESKAIPAAYSRPDLNVAALVPARMLLEQRHRNAITQERFQTQWDLLSQLSNEQQYREQQQRIFNQTQNLNLSGGGKQNRFSINGSYTTAKTEALGNSNRSWGLNFRDQLSLLANKLQITLQFNSNLNKAIAGQVLDPAELDPYQMLYKPDGSYVYDYVKSAINETRNTTFTKTYPGLQDFGYNPLQEARGTRNLNNNHSINSSLNLNWKLFEGFTWSNNLQYIKTGATTEQLRSANTSYARLAYNNYLAVNKTEQVEVFPGFFVPISTPLNPPVAYLPYGDIFQSFKNTSNSANLRSGFNYSRVFSQKHALNVALGLAYFNSKRRSDSNLPVYGYNSATGLGTALSLPSAEEALSNPLGLINFDRLTAVIPMVRQYDRNFSANSIIDYTYDQRLGMQAFYNESFMPIPNADVYSSTRNYNALAFWSLHKESFFKVPLISKLKLSAGLGEIKMASLPVNLPATRGFDADWGNYLEVRAYNAIRQNGEKIRNYDALLDLGLFKDVLQGQLNYRYNSMGVKNQVSGRLSYHISRASYFNVPWISNLMVEGLVSNISPAQALAQMMGTNTPLPGGGFSMATSNFNLGSLPPHIVNREISLRFGLWKDRVNTDVRYYNRSNSGLANSSFQADQSSGFSERPLYSRIDNKGYELYISAKILKGDGFNWTSIVNGAYNVNQVKDVINPRYFGLNASYLTANRVGYALGSLWSYRWAGLDNQGNPQIYDPNNQKVVIYSGSDPNSIEVEIKNPEDPRWIEYSGRTTPPWSGAFIQEFAYKGFYARATLRFALDHVMRTYRPSMTIYDIEKSSLIAQRWRKPGDEAKTDIPSIGLNSSLEPTRSFFTKYSSNSIAPADFFRLSELQFGYDVPKSWLKAKYVKNLSLHLNLQNVALWTRNKLGIDPEAILSDGTLLARQPLRYGLSLMVGF